MSQEAFHNLRVEGSTIMVKALLDLTQKHTDELGDDTGVALMLSTR